MNRKAFIKAIGAAAGAAVLGNIGFAEEGKKNMNKSIVIYFSHTGENYSVGVITVGNTAKVAKEIAAAYPKARVGQKGLALYGHVAQKEPESVKSAVAKWLLANYKTHG